MQKDNIVKLHAEYNRDDLKSLLSKHIESICKKIESNQSLTAQEKFICIILSFAEELKEKQHTRESFALLVNAKAKAEFNIYSQSYIKCDLLNFANQLFLTFNTNSDNKIDNVNMNEVDFVKFLEAQKTRTLHSYFNFFEITCKVSIVTYKKLLQSFKLNRNIYTLFNEYNDQIAIIRNHVLQS